MNEGTDSAQNRMQTSRRALLSAMGSTFVVGSGVVTADSVSERTIVVSKIGDEVKDTEQVPADWYQQLQEARFDLDQARTRFGRSEGVDDLMLVRSENKVGGKSGLAIRIEVSSEFDGDVPASINTTPVVVGQATEGEPLSCEYSESFINLPGGAKISNPDDSSSKSELGTAGSAVFHSGNYRHFTAAHTFDSCENDPTAYGDAEWLWHNGNSYGAVVEYSKTHDWAIINDFDDARYYTDKVESSSGTVGNINGHVTQDGLSSLMTSQDAVIEKVGIMTGHQQYGTLDGINTSGSYASGCIDMDGHGVKNSLNGTKGDSGGPVFRVNNGDLELISIVSTGTNDSMTNHDCSGTTLYEQTVGYGVYDIVNNYDVQF